MNLPHYPSPHVGAEFDLSEYDFNVVDSHALTVSMFCLLDPPCEFMYVLPI